MSVWPQLSLLGVLILASCGCSRPEPMYKPSGQPGVKLAIRLAKAEPFADAEMLHLPEGKQATDPRSGEPIPTLFVAKATVFTREDIAGTSTISHKDEGLEIHPDIPKRETTHWAVRVHFMSDSGKKLARFTQDNVGKWVALYYDDRFETVMYIYAPVKDGVLQISGNFTETQATQLAKSIVGDGGATPPASKR